MSKNRSKSVNSWYSRVAGLVVGVRAGELGCRKFERSREAPADRVDVFGHEAVRGLREAAVRSVADDLQFFGDQP